MASNQDNFQQTDTIVDIYDSAEDRLIYLQKLVAEDAKSAIKEFLAELSEYEIANLLESFPKDARQLIWRQVPVNLKGEVLAEVEDDIRPSLMKNMRAREIIALAEDLDAQDISEILDTVEEKVRGKVISKLDDDIRLQVTQLSTYDEWVVGHYMDPDTIQVHDNLSLNQVQKWLRSNIDLLDEQTQELIVVDKRYQLLGLLSLGDLIKYPQDSMVKQWIDPAITVNDRMDIQDAAAMFRSTDISFAPVVNSFGELVGQLNAEDIMEIIQDDVDSTMKSLAGVSDDEELFAPIIRSAKSRSLWLGINLITALLAAFVIGQFEAVLAQVVALAVLMPVVASMGGISGSQTLTVVIRGLAMGQIGGSNRLWLMNKELWVGAINGIIWAIIMAAIAQLWYHDPKISMVIGFAIAINMTVANVAGISIPLLLKRMDIDPALSASVILTTVTDIVGFMSFLGLASILIL